MQVPPMNGDDGPARFTGICPFIRQILFHVCSSGPRRHCSWFLWIDTHALSNAAFNISPFFAGTLHAPPNGHDAFFFSLTEIVYQTHFCISPFFGPLML